MMATSHREIARSFLDLVASGKVREAYSQYVSPAFRHHNPFFPGDRESLLSAMEENAAAHPHKLLEIRKIIDDGDLIVTYSRVLRDHGDIGVAVVHIFRFEEETIVELWDVGQAVPPDSPNDNGMF